MISIITPVFDESENLNELFSRIDKVFSNLKEKYEIIFVDNGSNDSSLDVIKGLAEKNSQIKFVSLTKNFGHQNFNYILNILNILRRLTNNPRFFIFSNFLRFIYIRNNN